LEGAQFNWVTPRTLSGNLTLQYSLTRTVSLTGRVCVWTHGEDLQVGLSTNNVSQLLPYNASTSNLCSMAGFLARQQLPVNELE
jgi:hypothetical protein